MRINSNDIGKAGEYRVCSELLLRGHRPLLSIVDSGIDIILENGVTIQVKTTSKAILQRGKRHFCFPFQSVRYTRGKSVHRNHMIADFAICWSIPNDTFLVIPKDEIGERYNITYSPDATIKSRPSRFAQFKDRWDLLS